MTVNIILAAVSVIAAYLIGSINFAVIFANAFLKKDVRKLGSGNAGTTNVMRTAGFLPGALTFICDALKGFISAFAGKLVFEHILNSGAKWAIPLYGAYACGLLCMLGHVFPAFFQFKGGKGVAVSVGIYAVCSPWAIIIGLAVFAVTVLISKMISLGSVLAAITVVTLSLVFYNGGGTLLIPAILSIGMGATVILKHTGNIKRLINGTENKIKLGRH